MSRHLIVVDCETTGLHDDAAILEIAAVNVDTGDELAFVPWVGSAVLGKAQPDAMAINRYYERRVYRDMLNESDTLRKFAELRTMLDGNTFGGSNPAFDSALVAAASYAYGWEMQFPTSIGKVWHHRLADTANYAAGILGLDVTELPGLDAVVDLVGHAFNRDRLGGDRHTALGDARLTAECFRVLRDWAPRNQAN